MTAFMPLAMEKDFRWDLMATGSGSLSMRWTGVHDTIARQHRSCIVKTGDTQGTGLRTGDARSILAKHWRHKILAKGYTGPAT